jgi:hypothetical protein
MLYGKQLSPDERLALRVISDLYARHVEAFTGIMRDAIAELIRRDPGLLNPFGAFHAESYAADQNSFVVAPLADGRVRVSLCVHRLTLDMKLGRFARGFVVVHSQPLLDDAVGTREEMVEFALLRWLAREPTGPAWRKILIQLGLGDRGDNVASWQAFLRAGSASVGRKEWIRRCLVSRNAAVVSAAVRAAVEDRELVASALAPILRDHTAPAPVRREILRSMMVPVEKDLLAAIVDLLGDPTAVEPDRLTMWDESFPFADDPLLEYARTTMKKPGRTTIGQEALLSLRWLTKKQLGDDPVAWRRELRL